MIEKCQMCGDSEGVVKLELFVGPPQPKGMRCRVHPAICCVECSLDLLKRLQPKRPAGMPLLAVHVRQMAGID